MKSSVGLVIVKRVLHQLHWFPERHNAPTTSLCPRKGDLFNLRIYWNISYRICQRTPVGYPTLRIFKPHNVTVLSGTSIQPYGTSRFLYCTSLPKIHAFGGTFYLNFTIKGKWHGKSGMSGLKERLEWDLKVTVMVQSVWGRKETHTNFYHSTLNGLQVAVRN